MKGTYKDGDIIIIRFTADWCAPCKRVSETIKNSKDIQDYVSSISGFITLDVDSSTEVVLKGYKITKPSSIPHFVKLKFDGDSWKEVSALSGAYPEQVLLNWMKK